MEGLIKKRLENSLGKTIVIVLKCNGWKYKGKLNSIDSNHLEILDFKTNSCKIIAIDDLSSLEIF